MVRDIIGTFINVLKILAGINPPPAKQRCNQV